jgi:hypothetical protein
VADVPQRFDIRFGRVNALFMQALGAGPSRSSVEVDGDRLRVRMGWMFRADVPRRSIVGVRQERYVWWAYGVHGWRGRWIVNGSGHGIVSVRVDPPAAGRVLGLRTRVRELWVSITDPESFHTALSA